MSIPAVFYYKKPQNLRKDIDRKIMFLQEAGLIKYWKDQEFQSGPKPKLNLEPTPLALNHLAIIFKILCAGHAVGLIGFTLELLYRKLGTLML